jgi:phosphatidylethanolamine-binding protein (PEBP) family uncharacterized protein
MRSALRWPSQGIGVHSTVGLLAIAALVAGCGGSFHASRSGARSGSTKQQEISFGSPAVSGSKKLIPVRYQCTGARIWLPLKWGAVPPHTGELVLYVGGYGSPRTLAPGRRLALITARSLVIGIKPSMHQLSAGGMPAGAHGLNRLGLPVCPPKHEGQEFVFRLYAISREQKINPDALKSQSPSELLTKISRETLAVGLFTARYGRT